jgi:hypothetical protein
MLALGGFLIGYPTLLFYKVLTGILGYKAT